MVTNYRVSTVALHYESPNRREVPDFPSKNAVYPVQVMNTKKGFRQNK